MISRPKEYGTNFIYQFKCVRMNLIHDIKTRKKWAKQESLKDA